MEGSVHFIETIFLCILECCIFQFSFFICTCSYLVFLTIDCCSLFTMLVTTRFSCDIAQLEMLQVSYDELLNVYNAMAVGETGRNGGKKPTSFEIISGVGKQLIIDVQQNQPKEEEKVKEP